jgi:hypothetical protein
MRLQQVGEEVYTRILKMLLVTYSDGFVALKLLNDAILSADSTELTVSNDMGK